MLKSVKAAARILYYKLKYFTMSRSSFVDLVLTLSKHAIVLGGSYLIIGELFDSCTRFVKEKIEDLNADDILTSVAEFGLTKHEAKVQNSHKTYLSLAVIFSYFNNFKYIEHHKSFDQNHLKELEKIPMGGYESKI